jgi:hypothetical protein
MKYEGAKCQHIVHKKFTFYLLIKLIVKRNDFASPKTANFKMTLESIMLDMSLYFLLHLTI